MTQADFEQKIQSFVGYTSGPYRSWDAVNRPMIRHWCEAMGDRNPAYTDSNAAAEVGGQNGGVVAPATMLQAWTMVGFAGEAAPGSDSKHAMPVLAELQEAGYRAVVATNCEQEYFEPVREGDQLHYLSTIEAISGEKTTGLGIGYFVTQLMEYRNQNEQKVGEMRFRILLYKPHQSNGENG